ncbi:aspartyl/glutamyl-tRNA(Asn/Gln) amidotransferase subunit B [Pontibacter ummariensis]|uniref:Aspartyl/glutamyl-tRNA(Asn/Gln) amidotransferase subunit B n=1 Tax=Pontibacter ummariensis TaxID=1610492 RepID=A0A239BU51_9BACT|nr:Asp-tRNA(Asn)/Glu-tRNA(Gln) amidotransferase subunit GatB [Pontibacter ummariensis]PRY15630.1 aspartyl/glutamyl-tRNA(Asn/Gln) amidotransferase subunit B [Pontibacter ummariensis]SNS11189.1 aspartyl/glutamyl-tRNA(Asn/Gln) amidotransferase subunit B [Pontibacter ummariensis]
MDKAIRDKYQAVIGLEVHAQLLTESKAYSSDSTEYGMLPNTNLSVITLAHPGTLPRVNKKVVEMAVKMGIATHSDITRYNVYARKNYFYPDLPKGYQITQDKTPVCTNGHLMVKDTEGNDKRIGITRIHMEEDAGKSMHLPGEVETLVDLNRAGVPLIEIVSEPDIRDSVEAYNYLTEIRRLVRYLEICDGNMEEGSLRCDANVSVMLKGAPLYGTKVEVKNMNSFRNVQRAIEHEIERQIMVLENGGKVEGETRGFDANTGTTTSQRSKETLNDYRYFPEPDLPPLIIEHEWLEGIKANMPSLPQELYKRFVEEYGLPEYDAAVLTDAKEIALYFEELCKHTTNYKAASNWMMGAVKSYLNELQLHMHDFPLAPVQIAQIIALVDENKVSHSVASKKIFPYMLEHPKTTAQQVAEEQNLLQESNADELTDIIQGVLSDNPAKVAEYKAGKQALIGMFMGEIMKKTKGKADPKVANKLLRESLNA